MSGKNRNGISSFEFLVAFSVMATVMTFATSLTVHVSRVWRDIELERLAVCELSNQLEVLTQLSGDALVESVKQITPSDFCRRGLDDPRISADLEMDKLGQRIDLELVFNRVPSEKSVRLSGWAIETNLSSPAKTEVQP